jgi:hypothetical protein
MSDISNGTSLQGYVTTTMRDLIAVFDEPTFYYPGDKVTVEWTHMFSDGSVATIYDWKRYDLGAPDMDELMEYNIGGFNRDVVELVKNAVLAKERLV